MRKKSIATVLLLLIAPFAVQAQQVRELLQAVGPDQAKRLEDYNSTFLQEVLYSAVRHRIVTVNGDLLLENDAVTITPFRDVNPIVIAPERIRRTDDSVTWLGRIQVDPRVEQTGAKFYANMSMNWWDVNEDGNAEISLQNRFEFSPEWIIDENDMPVRRAQGQGVNPSEVGPPPETAEEIAEHKRLSRLDRLAFSSLRTLLTLPNGKTFVVAPLRHTPKYAVVYESDNESIPVLFESSNQDRLSDEHKQRIEEYSTFLENLPREEAKAVRADIQ